MLSCEIHVSKGGALHFLEILHKQNTLELIMKLDYKYAN